MNKLNQNSVDFIGVLISVIIVSIADVISIIITSYYYYY
jgi:hypothetical protein